MDIPAFSRSGMSGTGRKSITNYGNSKYDLEEVSRRFCREPIGPSRWKHVNTESNSRWHSSAGNYKKSRDSLDATTVWEGGSAYEKSQKKSYRTRSRSPARRFDLDSVNERSGRIATYGCRNGRNDKPRNTSTIPCKFFATGSCRHGSFCRFSHNDRTHDSFSNYKPDGHVQGIDRVYMSPLRASDFNISPCHRDENEEFGEQRAMRSSADDNATTEDSFKAHQMDNDEQTRNEGRSHLSLTAHSSSGMGVSESRGSNYKPDGHVQGIDRVYMSPLRASDFNISPCHQDENEELGEQRAMRSSADDNATTEDSFKAHQMDDDEQTRNEGRSHLSLTAHSSSGMSVSESRGTAILVADIEGSITYTENQLPTLNGTPRKPDILDTVKPESEASNQCQIENEQISRLTNTLTQLLGNGKQLSELYAALNASNTLGFMQSFVSGPAGPDVPASASNQYDPVTDSLELVNSVISEQQDGIALTSQLLLSGGRGADGLYGTDCKKAELNVNSLQSSKKALSADSKNEEKSILKAREMKEDSIGGQLVNNEGDGKAAEIKKNSDGKNLQTSEKAAFSDCKNQEHSVVKVGVIKKGQDRSKIVNNEGDDKADEIKKNNDGKSLHAFKFSLAEFVKELMCPMWKEGQINKEAYKTVVKNVVDKVIASIQSIHIPQTKEKIDNYLSASKPKILKLLKAYIEKVKEEESNIA